MLSLVKSGQSGPLQTMKWIGGRFARDTLPDLATISHHDFNEEASVFGRWWLWCESAMSSANSVV